MARQRKKLHEKGVVGQCCPAQAAGGKDKKPSWLGKTGVSKSAEPSTEWSQQRGGFIILLPKKADTYPVEHLPVFKGEIISCFKEKKALPVRSGGGGGMADSTSAGDDWADVEMDKATGRLAVVEKAAPSVAPASSSPAAAAGSTVAEPEYLPDVRTLGRPDDLLTRPPYHLIVHASGLTKVEVQCSHSATLQFLSEYLKRWCRTNHNLSTKPPSVKVELHQCAFGLGLIYDRMTLEVENRYGVIQSIPPTVVLALIEGVLGYKQVYTNGTTWTYRKDVQFKSL